MNLKQFDPAPADIEPPNDILATDYRRSSMRTFPES